MWAGRRDLTPPSSGRGKGRFAPLAPPLMSNVRPHLCWICKTPSPQSKLSSRLLSRRHKGDAWVVYPEHTQEHQFGWVVFFGSRLIRGTGSKENAIAGNAPFLVNRLSGAVEVTGTSRPVESYVTEYNARNANGGA